MSEALFIAASGLKSEEYYIDKIANDLANLNTNNYKATRLTFEDVMVQNIHGDMPFFQNQASAKIETTPNSPHSLRHMAQTIYPEPPVN